MSHSEIPKDGALVWTSVGIARQTRLVSEAETKYKALIAEMVDNSDGKIVVSETESADQGTLKTEKAMLKDSWDIARTLLGRLRPPPANSSSINRACVDKVVGVEYLDDDVIERRGKQEVFLLGGIGETDPDAKLRTYSVNSPLGAAVKGKQVGEVCTVRLPGGQEYDVKVVAVSALTKEDEILASTVADRSETTITRLSIDATGQRVPAAA